MNTDMIVQFTVTAGLALVIASVGIALSIIVAQILRRSLGQIVEKSILGFIVSMSRVIIVGYTAYLVVNQTGAAGVIVMVVTALTGAFALGSERIAGDFVAGINLFAARYYKIGDRVTINGITGKVQSITMTYTTITHYERDLVILPNASILGQTVINHSAIPGVLLHAAYFISGAHDRKFVLKKLKELAESFEYRIRGDGEEYEAYLWEVTETEWSTVSYYGIDVFAPESCAGYECYLLEHIRIGMEEHIAVRDPAA